LAYDGFRESDALVLPHVVSFSYAVIAALIKRFMVVAESTKSLNADRIKEIWEKSLEEEIAPRRFGRGPGQIMRGPPIEIEWEQS